MSDSDSSLSKGASFEEIGAAAYEEAEREVLARIAELARATGSVTQAVDLYAVNRYSQREWAEMTDRRRESVSQSVRRAGEAISLSSSEEEEEEDSE
jgi:hypothetical protein